MHALLRGLPPLTDRAAWKTALTTPDAPPLVQFVKYGLAGVCAMAANLLFFWISDRFFFPIGAGEAAPIPPPEGVSDLLNWMGRMAADLRVLNYFRCNLIAFLFSNVVAYVLNFKWVFRAGRHKRHVEIFLFFFVSFVSFVLGTALASVLVGSFGVHEYLAKIGDVSAAVLINYVCRKFLIFHG